jgi:hypothetical protein
MMQAITINDSPRYAGCLTKRYIPFETTFLMPGKMAKLLPKNKKDRMVKMPPNAKIISAVYDQFISGFASLKRNPAAIKEGKLINKA